MNSLSECACRIEIETAMIAVDKFPFVGTESRKWVIAYCPRHLAVDVLVEACKKTLESLRIFYGGQSEDQTIKLLEDALAQAEGGK